MPVGEIVELWRYPVKSMQGERLESAAVTTRGLVGDRAYAILDCETGHIASAKHPRKWRRLFACRAAFAEPPHAGQPLPPVWITLPDGNVISSADPSIDQILSHVLGRAVTLVTVAPPNASREADRTPIDHVPAAAIIRHEVLALAAPVGTFFDYAPLHVLTTATLNRLQELYPAGQIEARRFRPNIVVASVANEPGFVETDWLGKSLHIGAAVRLQLIDPCPRCVVITLAQDDLSDDMGILRTVTQHATAASVTLAPGVVFPAVAGVYADVRNGGWITRGETAWLMTGSADIPLQG